MNRNITATILIVLAIGIYFTVTQNILNTAKTVKTVNDKYLSAINSATELLKSLSKVQQDYNNISARDREGLVKMIPNTVDNIRLIIDTNSIAVAHGLTLSGITASADSKSSGPASPRSDNAALPPGTILPTTGSAPTLDTVSVSFSVTCLYQQCLSFLQDIESNLRLMDITHITFGPGEKSTYNMMVQLKTYWLRQ